MDVELPSIQKTKRRRRRRGRKRHETNVPEEIAGNTVSIPVENKKRKRTRRRKNKSKEITYYTVDINPLEILLKDVSSEEFIYIINFSPEWRNIMQPKMTEKLLPLVFPVLLKYLSPKTILNCREVSKKLQQMIDLTIHQTTFESIRKFEEESFIYSFNENHRFKLCLQTLFRRQFCHDFKSCLANRNDNKDIPFLSNYLPMTVSDMLETHNATTRLCDDTLPSTISTFGHHITHLNLDFSYHNYFYRELLPILGVVPNLKILQLSGDHIKINLDNTEGILPFPELPRLETLLLGTLSFSFSGSSSKLSAMRHPYTFPLVQHYDSQIITFSYNGEFFDWSNRMDTELLANVLPNMRRLLLRDTGCWMDMGKISVINCSLEQVVVSNYAYGDEGKIFQAFKNFKDTLKTIILLSPYYAGISCVKFLEPLEKEAFTNLKELKLDYSYAEDNNIWEFIAHCCPKLEVLYFTLEGSFSRSKKAAQIQFFKELKKKAVGLPPKLRQICFEFADDLNLQELKM